MSDITREELLAFTEVHAKSAIALEKITDRLEELTSKQDTMIDKLTNGLIDKIADKVEEKFNHSNIAKDIGYSKFFIAAIAILIIIINVVVGGVERRANINSEIKKIITQEQIQK